MLKTTFGEVSFAAEFAEFDNDFITLLILAILTMSVVDPVGATSVKIKLKPVRKGSIKSDNYMQQL